MDKLKVSTTCAMLLCVAGTALGNQVLDPSFTSGFGSDYNFVPPGETDRSGPDGSWAEGTYAIDTNPNNDHSLWYSFGSPSGGYMMIVNGAVTAGERVWYETLGPGTYDFNALVANSYPVSTPSLVLELDGKQIGPVFNSITPPGAAPGTWTEWSSTFTVDGTETLSIVDLDTDASGNDFALASASVPDGGMTALMLSVGLLGLGWMRRMVKQ